MGNMEMTNAYLKQLEADKKTLTKLLLEGVGLLQEAVWESYDHHLTMPDGEGIATWLATEDEQYDDTTVLGRAREFVGKLDNFNDAIYVGKIGNPDRDNCWDLLQKDTEKEVKENG